MFIVWDNNKHELHSAIAARAYVFTDNQPPVLENSLDELFGYNPGHLNLYAKSIVVRGDVLLHDVVGKDTKAYQIMDTVSANIFIKMSKGFGDNYQIYDALEALNHLLHKEG